MKFNNLNKDRTERRKTEVNHHALVYGKVPPQSKDLEVAILGAILMERGALERVAELLRPECFYVEAHQRIFSAMQAMSISGITIDSLTVGEQLLKTEELELIGGQYFIDKLTSFVVSSAHVEQHCQIIYEKYLKREMIRIGGQLVFEAYEDSSDAFEVMDQHEKEYQKISLQQKGNSITDLTGTLVERYQRLFALQKKSHHVTGIPSGFVRLDHITHGWQNTDLIILAARPAVGKTAFALNMARNAVRQPLNNGKKSIVLFFSLEMSKSQLVDRLLASESETWLEKIKTGMMEEDHLKKIFSHGVQPLSQLGIYIDDTPALNIYQLRSKARYMQRKFGSADTEILIIIDYLQLMSGMDDRKPGNREQEISYISRSLKKLAKEMNLPIIALSQLSRAVETRGSKEGSKVPQLSDLRESGAIEQDADMVMFMYRPEYYDITAGPDGENTKGLTEISIAKHRNGSLATGSEAIKLKADLAIQKFYDWDSLEDVKSKLPTGGSWRPVVTEKRDEPGDLPF